MIAPIGAEVQIRYGCMDRYPYPVEVGHFLQTRTGRTYLITKTGKRGRTVGLRCMIVSPDIIDPDEDTVHRLIWNKR